LNYLLGAFFWSYALGQLPAGWLGDRYGARWMLGLFIVLWSLSTGLLGFATTLAGVWWLRMSCGLFEAGAYPLAAGIVRRWVPLHSRGLASSLIAVGGRLGGALAPIATIQLMLWWTYGEQWSEISEVRRGCR
jgi:MFS family permease